MQSRRISTVRKTRTDFIFGIMGRNGEEGELARGLSFLRVHFLERNEAEAGPDCLGGCDELVDELRGVQRTGGETEQLATFGDGGVVDGLHVDAELLEQSVADLFALIRIPNEQWDNMTLTGKQG